MAASLNPNATPFVPQSQWTYGWAYVPYAEPESEECVTSEELEELEACEEWVKLQAELEELEREHLVSLALSEAAPEQIAAIEMRAMASESGETAQPVRERKQRRHSKQ